MHTKYMHSRQLACFKDVYAMIYHMLNLVVHVVYMVYYSPSSTCEVDSVDKFGVDIWKNIKIDSHIPPS